MKKPYRTSTAILLTLLIALASINCGGGGGSSNESSGGGPSTITYVGLTNPAAITEADSEELLFGSLLGAEAGGYFSLTSESKDEIPQGMQEEAFSDHPIAIDLPLVLKNTAKNISLADSKPYSLSALASTTTEAINGSCGGSATYHLNINDTTGAFDGTFDFSQYCENNIVISGGTDINGTANLATGEITTIAYAFENLTVDAFVFRGNVFVNDAATPQMITLDVLFKDNSSNKVYWANDYVLSITGINETDVEIDVTGTYYDPDQGYVIVSTPEPLMVSTGDWPIHGVLLCVGGNNTKTKLTAISASSYRIEADTNGDDVYDYNSGMLTWPGVAGFTHSGTRGVSDIRTAKGGTLKT